MSPSASAQAFVLVGEVSDVGEPGRQASAVRVESGVIVEVGREEVVTRAESEAVPVVDLGDRYVAPGFVDAHAHLEVGVRAQTELLDCRVPLVHSIDDLLDHLASNVGRAREGWLVGQANLFFDRKLADGRLPTRQELDSISPRLAIAVRAGGHTSILNTKALETFDIARYEAGEGMMGGALVGRDESGQLTGMIAELDNAVPFPSPEPGQFEEALPAAAHDLFTRFGVTTVGDISESLGGLRAIRDAALNGKMPLRVSTHLWAPGTLSFEDAWRWREVFDEGSDSSLFRVRGLKVFADGGFSSRNAAVFTPFLELPRDEAYGRLNIGADRLAEYVRRADEVGLQLIVHANGERAQAAACEAAVTAGPAGWPMRLEHAGNLVTREETYERWRDADVVPVSQAAFLYNFGDFFAPLLGHSISRGLFPFRTMLERGFAPAMSSDVHLGSEPAQTNPLFSMWCAVERRTFLGATANPAEAVSVREALEMHTLAPAIALGREDSVGTIEVGKLADFAVLSSNPESATSLLDLEVELVMTGGKVVHHAPPLTSVLARLRP